MNSPTLILASVSPRRSDLLRQADYDFVIVPSAVEESASPDLTAGELAQLNAYRKAQAVARKHPDDIVMGVDTVVVLGSNVFGKPGDMAEAEEMIATLQGKTHTVVTGVCLIHLRRHHRKIFKEQTKVTFRKLTRDQIRRYHAVVNPLDKAGAYSVQEKGGTIVESVSGSISNVAGLPMERLAVELAAFGISPLAAS